MQSHSLIGEFPSGPVVRTPHFLCSGPGFDPWSGNQDPTSHTTQPKINKVMHLFIKSLLCDGQQNKTKQKEPLTSPKKPVLYLHFKKVKIIYGKDL